MIPEPFYVVPTVSDTSDYLTIAQVRGKVLKEQGNKSG
jgi:hypothetical protein